MPCREVAALFNRRLLAVGWALAFRLRDLTASYLGRLRKPGFPHYPGNWFEELGRLPPRALLNERLAAGGGQEGQGRSCTGTGGRGGGCGAAGEVCAGGGSRAVVRSAPGWTTHRPGAGCCRNGVLLGSQA